MTDQPDPAAVRLHTAIVRYGGSPVVRLPGSTHTPLRALVVPVATEEGGRRHDCAVVFQVAGAGEQRATIRVVCDGSPAALEGFVYAGSVQGDGYANHVFASWSSERVKHEPEPVDDP